MQIRAQLFDQLADFVHDRLWRRINLFDQCGELLAIHRGDVEFLLFEGTPAKSVEKTVKKRGAELAAFIRTNLKELRGHNLDYGGRL